MAFGLFLVRLFHGLIFSGPLLLAIRPPLYTSGDGPGAETEFLVVNGAPLANARLLVYGAEFLWHHRHYAALPG